MGVETIQSSKPQPGRTSDGPVAAVAAVGLRVDLGDRPILRDIGLNIAVGSTTALLGANGAGKSTLLKVLAGLLQRSGGKLELFGHEVTADNPKIRARIGIIAHQPILYRDLSVRENLEFFGKLYDVDAPSDRADELMELVNMSRRADQPVKQLSRGMTQRVSIARALMHDPDLLLADEPFNGLDDPSRRMTETFLDQLRGQGKTVIFSNHDITQSLKMADAVLVLRQGSLVIDAPADELSDEVILKEMRNACPTR